MSLPTSPLDAIALWVGNMGEWHEKHLLNFAHPGPWAKALRLIGRNNANNRGDDKAADGLMRGKPAEELYACGVKGDFFPCLAKGRSLNRTVLRLNPPAGQSDLPGMGWQAKRTARQDHLRLSLSLEDRNEHSRMLQTRVRGAKFRI